MTHEEYHALDRQLEQRSTAAPRPHKAYGEMTPQEAHDQMKELVSKAIATAAGAIEGVADTMKQNHLPDKAGEAVHTLGEAGRKVGMASKEEFDRIRSDINRGAPSADPAGPERSRPSSAQDSLEQPAPRGRFKE